jgi:peptide/nickel transport system permease protein
VLVTLQAGYIVLLESTLSFLGVGIPPSTPAWGLMISEGRTVMDSAWWVVLWPGLAILLMVLSGNLLGDWLRDRLDPTLKQV